MYYRILKIYSDLENIVEKHAKRINEAKISLKNYFKTSNELYLRRFLAIIDNLRTDRQIILKRAEEASRVDLSTIDLNDLKYALEIFDYIYALLDYHRLVDLEEERKIFVLAMEKAVGTALNEYREIFEKDISNVEENMLKLDCFLENIKTIISDGLKMVDDKEFVENYIRNLSFKLEKPRET